MPDLKTFNKVFSKYKNKVYWLALSITRNPADAEDVAQNAFLKIARGIGKFRRESQFFTWVYKITYNEALMFLRKRKSQLRLSRKLQDERDKATDGLFVNWAKLPDEKLLDEELKERINESVKNLPIKYRMPILLGYIESLPHKESARILGLKVNSLKTRLRRGQLQLRSDITQYFQDTQRPKEKRDKRCSIWTDFIVNFADGKFPETKRRHFKQHITDCQNCNTFLDSYLKAIAITKALECRDIPFELKERIETFLSAGSKKP